MIGFDVDTSDLGRDQVLVVEFRRVVPIITFMSGYPNMLSNRGGDQLLDLGGGDAAECGRLGCLSLDEGRRDVKRYRTPALVACVGVIRSPRPSKIRPINSESEACRAAM